MREYWLTNELNLKWSLATTSRSPFVSVKNLTSNVKNTYWAGKRTFIKTDENDSQVTVSGTIWFLDGDFSANDFLRFVAKSETLLLWARRDGIGERCCEVDFSLDSRGERQGQAVALTVSFERLTPWRSKTRIYTFSSTGYHCLVKFINNSDRESPFCLKLFVESEGTNLAKVIVSDKELILSGTTLSIPDGVRCISENYDSGSDSENILFMTEEGKQKVQVGPDYENDAYSSIDFTKDSFFQVKPNQNELHIYESDVATEWGFSGTLEFFDQFLEG